MALQEFDLGWKLLLAVPKNMRSRFEVEPSTGESACSVALLETSGESNASEAPGEGASAVHAKHQFRLGDQIEGLGHGVPDPHLETADVYKVSKLNVTLRGEESMTTAPWNGVPPPLEVYRVRGHRRLAATTYDSKCNSCIWGCVMPVEIIVDHWNPGRRRYRTETFCYGPLSCSVYNPGRHAKFQVATA